MDDERFTAPGWLPSGLVGLWDFLAAYEVILGLVVVLVGTGLAVMGRFAVLFWARKLTARRSHLQDARSPGPAA